MIELREPYEQRPVRPLERWEIDGWRLKVYGIAYRREVPRPELVTAARGVAERVLAGPAAVTEHHGVGFVGIHDGRGACFVFVDWWADENELHHHVFVAPSERPVELEDRTATGLAACAWDLAVICFERSAWAHTVLAGRPPDVEAYLGKMLDAEV